MGNDQNFIHRILPYRLQAVEVLGLAIRYRLSWAKPVDMKIYFEERLCIDGLSTAFTNPVIEAGVIHCRALLEFVGLTADPKVYGKLSSRRRPHPNDLSIEQFTSASGGGLKRVTPVQAVLLYDGPSDEAEHALARVIHIANKGVAHSTVGLVDDPADLHLIESASGIVRDVLVNHFYAPLGLKAPSDGITSRTIRGGETRLEVHVH